MITLAAKYKSPEKSRLGKQKGKSKQTLNRTPQASFVAMLNSKGLLQIREEFLKEKRSQEPFTRKNVVTRLGTSSWYKRNTEAVSCTNPVCLYNSHSITAFPLTSVFKNNKKNTKTCGSVSFWWSEFEVQNKHGIIDSLTKTLPMKFQSQTLGSALLPLPSAQPSPSTPASPGLRSTVHTDSVTFYFKICHVPHNRRKNISGTF